MNPERPLKNALVIVIAGVVLGIGSNVLHPHPLPWKPEKKKMVMLTDPVAPPDPTANTDPGEGTDPAPGKTTTSDGMPSDGRATPPMTNPDANVPSFKPIQDGYGTREQAPATTTTPAAADAYADIPESQFPIEIHLAKAKELYDRGGLLVLDARERPEYDEGHIQGALSADADKKVADMQWLEKTAADPRPIMTYCDGGDCELSLDLGFEIARTGHRKVMVFVDGYPAWKDAGYPVDTGDTP